MKFFKSILHPLLTVALITSFTFGSFAGTRGQVNTTDAGRYQTEFDAISGRLNALEYGGAETVTKEMAEATMATYSDAFELLKKIIADNSFDADQSSKMIGKLLGNMSRATFQVMRHKADVADPTGQVPLARRFTRTLAEMGRDVISIFPYATIKQGEGLRFHAPMALEQARREKLIRNLLVIIKQNFDIEVPAVNAESDKVKEFYFGQFHYLVDRAVNIRLERNSAQLWARMTYFAAGVFLFLNPIESPFGEANFYSAWNAGVVEFATFATLYVVKGMTSSRDSAQAWVDLYKDLMASKSKELTAKIRSTLKQYFSGKGPSSDYYEANIPEKFDFENRLQDTIKKFIDPLWGTCKGFLTAKKKA